MIIISMISSTLLLYINFLHKFYHHLQFITINICLYLYLKLNAVVRYSFDRIRYYYRYWLWVFHGYATSTVKSTKRQSLFARFC